MGDIFSKNESLEFFIPPSLNIEGPLGLGDPSDKSLSKFETDTIIPTLVVSNARKKHCYDEWDKLANCNKSYGWLSAAFCRSTFFKALECNMLYLNDKDYRKSATEQYLNIRSKYRKTGVEDMHHESLKTSI